MVLCRYLFMYPFNKSGTGARAWVAVKTWAGAGIRVQVMASALLPLVSTLLINLSLLIKKELRQLCGTAIWLAGKVNFEGNYNFYFFKQAGLSIWFRALRIVTDLT